MRLYAFLSQIFDYGNTDIEKRFLFYKRLIPLLDFGRERDLVDLSKVLLTHHTLKNHGKQPLNLNADGTSTLIPTNVKTSTINRRVPMLSPATALAGGETSGVGA